MKSSDESYSAGCRICQNGRWLCIFLTHLCNGGCSFCPALVKNSDTIISAFGDDLQSNLTNVKTHHFNGVSFSGGDCFLVFERLMEWLGAFKKEHVNCYYWAYTNGLSATTEKMTALARAGLDELRFNIAATGYDDPGILVRIKKAVELFTHVAVEIPSIPGDFYRLCRVLPKLDCYGVQYLNLHEFVLMPQDPLAAASQSGSFLLNYEMDIRYDLLSRANTARIEQFNLEHGLRMTVNDCSLRQKEKQMKRRRLTMGRIFRRAHERLTSDGFLETIVCLPADYPVDPEKMHPDDWLPFSVHPAKWDSRCSRNEKVFRLEFLPPLGIAENRVLHRSVRM